MGCPSPVRSLAGWGRFASSSRAGRREDAGSRLEWSSGREGAAGALALEGCRRERGLEWRDLRAETAGLCGSCTEGGWWGDRGRLRQETWGGSARLGRAAVGTVVVAYGSGCCGWPLSGVWPPTRLGVARRTTGVGVSVSFALETVGGNVGQGVVCRRFVGSMRSGGWSAAGRSSGREGAYEGLDLVALAWSVTPPTRIGEERPARGDTREGALLL